MKMFVSSNLTIENKNRNEFHFACWIGKQFLKTVSSVCNSITEDGALC